MWNYEFVIPTVMTFLIMLVCYFSRPHPPVRLNRTFLFLMLTETATFLLDYISSRACEEYAVLSPFLLWIANMAYFICFLCRIYYYFRFTTDALGLFVSTSPLMRWSARIPVLITGAIVLSSFVTRAVFFIDADGYHRGALYDVLYVCAFFYILYAITLIVRRASALRRHEIIGLLACQLLLFAGFIARIAFPYHLVLNTFCVMALLVIFLVFVNPDLYLSDRGNAFNTRALRDVLADGLASGHRERILALVLRDYNDQRSVSGGAQMDRAIRQICHDLSRLCPKEYIFYVRSGRFIILGREEMDARQLREQIQERFRRPWSAKDLHLYLTPAFVHFRPDGKVATPDSIIDTLMIALENAGKSSAPDYMEEADSMEIISRQVVVKRSMENALENNRVEVFLQPIYDCRKDRIVGAEALARIRDERGNLISPGEFIPIAEKSGRIIELGEQVLRNTCRFIQHVDPGALGLSWINVNLSPVQCIQGDLAERFELIMQQTGVDPAMIHLEITEQSMIDYMLLQRQMVSLKQKGFLFALDDYGSGYSNLSRVKRFPFVNIKLDMDLVRDCLKDDDPLLSTLIPLFHKMGFSITAEGVETGEMARQLREIGCDFLQGYYYSRPLPTDEFIRKYSASAS